MYSPPKIMILWLPTFASFIILSCTYELDIFGGSSRSPVRVVFNNQLRTDCLVHRTPLSEVNNKNLKEESVVCMTASVKKSVHVR